MSSAQKPGDEDEELFTSPRMYRLLRAGDGSLAIEVAIGGIATSTMRVRLTAEEATAYQREGRVATDRLAQDIEANPPFFGRAVAVS